jgi:outer membrane protein assembly factor BamB
MGMQIGLDEVIFIGVKGTVLALHRQSGMEIWRTKLKGSSFTNLVRDGNEILASTQGELFCLDAVSGQLKWANPLKGMGFGIVTIANNTNTAAMAQKISDDESSSSTVTNPAMTPAT